MANRLQKLTTYDVLASALRTIIRIQRKNGTPNIFLIQNKGKGPPGRSRSPDRGHFLFSDPKPTAGKSSKFTDQIINYQCFNFSHN